MTAHERKKRAWDLFRRGQFEEAALDYEWLWRNIPTVAPELSAVRVTTVAREVRLLCDVHPTARSRFERVRDDAGRAAAENPAIDSDDRFEWIVLNGILGDGDASLKWFDEVDLGVLSDRSLRSFLSQLTPALVERGRWHDVGRLQRDPPGMIRALQETVRLTSGRPKGLSPAVKERASAEVWQFFREQAVILYRSLLRAGRTAEAEAVFEEAVRFDQDPEMAQLLVAAASADDAMASS
jgi:hypothetical protein